MIQFFQKCPESIDSDANSIPTQFEVFRTVTSATGLCYISSDELRCVTAGGLEKVEPP